MSSALLNIVEAALNGGINMSWKERLIDLWLLSEEKITVFKYTWPTEK